MTGTAGIIMWLMMALMIAAVGAGLLTWAKRRLRRQTAQQPPTQAPAGPAPPPKAPKDE